MYTANGILNLSSWGNCFLFVDKGNTIKNAEDKIGKVPNFPTLHSVT